MSWSTFIVGPVRPTRLVWPAHSPCCSLGAPIWLRLSGGENAAAEPRMASETALERNIVRKTSGNGPRSPRTKTARVNNPQKSTALLRIPRSGHRKYNFQPRFEPLRSDSKIRVCVISVDGFVIPSTGGRRLSSYLIYLSLPVGCSGDLTATHLGGLVFAVNRRTWVSRCQSQEDRRGEGAAWSSRSRCGSTACSRRTCR